LSDDSIKNKIVYDAYNIINNNDSSNKKITNKEIKKNRVNLEERFADYKEENLSKEFAWDDPVGKEIL
jgi:antitoxin component of MazEF toxin-antitoxin module